ALQLPLDPALDRLVLELDPLRRGLVLVVLAEVTPGVPDPLRRGAGGLGVAFAARPGQVGARLGDGLVEGVGLLISAGFWRPLRIGEVALVRYPRRGDADEASHDGVLNADLLLRDDDVALAVADPALQPRPGDHHVL